MNFTKNAIVLSVTLALSVPALAAIDPEVQTELDKINDNINNAVQFTSDVQDITTTNALSIDRVETKTDTNKASIDNLKAQQ